GGRGDGNEIVGGVQPVGGKSASDAGEPVRELRDEPGIEEAGPTVLATDRRCRARATTLRGASSARSSTSGRKRRPCSSTIRAPAPRTASEMRNPGPASAVG